MSADKKNQSAELFKNSVIVLLTLIGVFVAIVTFLQGYASLRSEDLIQQSEFTAVNSTGLSFRAGLEAARGVDVRQQYAEYLQRSVRADTKARALRLGGSGDLAAEFALDAERWARAAAAVAQSNPLLAEYGEDEILYREVLAREAYVESERQHVLLAQSRAWGDKDKGLVAILSTLSVALFLEGLSLTIGSRVKYLLAAAGAGLSLICVVWMAAVLLSPVPRVSEEAIQNFVDGQIKYNMAVARGEDAVDAMVDFNAAIRLAPAYGRAYFYRSLANTDDRLADIQLDTGQAIADGERALALGIETSPVYGNLGWLYFLNGQYNSALTATETALALSPDECYVAFNHGLILTALQRQAEAGASYTRAIACARNQSDNLRNYYLDVGVVDLEDLALARPDLLPSIQPAVQRLKETVAALRLSGDTVSYATPAQLGPLTFGESVDLSNQVVDPAAEFPQTATVVYADFDFSGMWPEAQWLERWLLNGREYFSLVHEGWDFGESGRAWIGVANAGGLSSGRYQVDVFVEGSLLTSGQFVVRNGPMPPMTSYDATDIGVIVNYPLAWRITELADYEVSVVAARDPHSPTFFGVTAWTTTTGTDEDIFQLFDLNFEASRRAFKNFRFEERQAFLVAGRDGWLNYYSYTDPAGNGIQGALAGVLDPDSQLVFILVIEAHADEWDANIDLFNLMLSRISITG